MLTRDFTTASRQGRLTGHTYTGCEGDASHRLSDSFSCSAIGWLEGHFLTFVPESRLAECEWGIAAGQNDSWQPQERVGIRGAGVGFWCVCLVRVLLLVLVLVVVVVLTCGSCVRVVRAQPRRAKAAVVPSLCLSLLPATRVSSGAYTALDGCFVLFWRLHDHVRERALNVLCMCAASTWVIL